MPQARPLSPLPLSSDERDRLEQWASARDRRLARRAALVLGFAAGEEVKVLARRFRLSEPTAIKWRARFEGSRLDGLADAARPGAPRRILADDVKRVIAHLRQPPPRGQARWMTRSLARTCGLSQTTVSRIWRAHRIDPRSGAIAPADAGVSGGPERPAPVSNPAGDAGEVWGSELARLVRELGELRAVAPLEQVPFLRVALEALEAAVFSSRLRAAREGSRVVRARTEAAIAQARALVKEARARIAELQSMGEALHQRSNRGPRDGERDDQ